MAEEIRKFIYFPNDYHNKKPVVIAVDNQWGNEWRGEWRGSESVKDLQEGRFSFYPMTRCQPYSEALWLACLQWLARRDLLEVEYRELMKRGVRQDG